MKAVRRAKCVCVKDGKVVECETSGSVAVGEEGGSNSGFLGWPTSAAVQAAPRKPARLLRATGQ
jgi:hypothetical protein